MAEPLSTPHCETVKAAEAISSAGLSGAELEVQADLLIVRLDPESGRRLLADAALRARVVQGAQATGFSRVALELL